MLKGFIFFGAEVFVPVRDATCRVFLSGENELPSSWDAEAFHHPVRSLWWSLMPNAREKGGRIKRPVFSSFPQVR